ncbi:MAG: septum formation initiator family protein [Endozoicomonas sp. (ex Botrylloides leachii)]|nr:septum formation initiator family protein [Endozoicomonas sp. (ex Botrylloides leachii)]
MQKLFIALLMVILIYLQSRLWIGQGSVSEMISLREKIGQEQLERDRLALRNQRLANEVIELQAGLNTIEKEAREELGMVKPDETFYLIYE